MERPRDDDHIERFVLQLLSTGSMLAGLVGDLADALPVDAYPGEEPADVVVEMMYGTIATAVGAVDPEKVRAATELIGLAGAQVIEHLRVARELSRRIHPGDSGHGRNHG